VTEACRVLQTFFEAHLFVYLGMAPFHTACVLEFSTCTMTDGVVKASSCRSFLCASEPLLALQARYYAFFVFFVFPRGVLNWYDLAGKSISASLFAGHGTHE